MSEPEKPATQKAEDFLTPASFIRAAQEAHPAFRYAVVIAGILAIVVTFAKFGVGYATLVFGAIALLFLMILFLVFAQAAQLTRSTLDLPAQVLVWAFLAIAIAFALFLTSSTFFNAPLPFRDWIVQELSKAGVQTKPMAEVPVTLTAVYRDSHAPVARTIFTVIEKNTHLIHQEVMSDANGSATFQLFPGTYELLTTGANENLTFVVTALQTTITVQVEPKTPAPSTESVTTTETYQSDDAASGSCKDFGAWASVCSPDKPPGWTISYQHFELTGDRAGCQYAECGPVGTPTDTKVCYHFRTQGHDEECGHSGNTGIHYSKGVLTVVWKHPA
jgi:hypothetical protein